MCDDPVQDLIHLYEDGALKRRDLIRRLARYTGSVAAAMAALQTAGLAQTAMPNCPAGTNVAEDDPGILGESLTIGGTGGQLFVYQARPRPITATALPMVLVVHENQGLTPYIKDVTRRVAKAGYVAVAVDLLSRQGGTSKFPDATSAAAAYNKTLQEERIQDMVSTLDTFRQQPYIVMDKLAALGFCAGGNNVLNLASATDWLNGAVVYYGPAPSSVDAVAKSKPALLLLYPELDRGTTTPLPAMLSALIAAQKRYELHIYPNANHAFHNDTSPRYDPAAACDAWGKTLAFFGRTFGAIGGNILA